MYGIVEEEGFGRGDVGVEVVEEVCVVKGIRVFRYLFFKDLMIFLGKFLDVVVCLLWILGDYKF